MSAREGEAISMRPQTEARHVRTIQNLVEGLCGIPKATFTREARPPGDSADGPLPRLD